MTAPPDLSSVAALVTAARDGAPRAVARLLSMVENAHPALPEVMAQLSPFVGGARIVGITGAPGVGKSTITSALVTALRARGVRVAVLAVDPSSPFSGGALLGDRIRMQEHATDPGVFIRSMASRGHLGGLAWSTPQALRVLDGAGFGVVLIETVGVGQSEVEVAALADTCVVLLAPGMGDGIQSAKAGILEIGDLFVVNKADRDGAQNTVHDLRHMVSLAALADGRPGRWRPPVLTTVASNGTGIDEVLEYLDRHHDWATGCGDLARRRQARGAAEIEAIVLAGLRQQIARVRDGALLEELAAQVAAGRNDPYTAAGELLRELG